MIRNGWERRQLLAQEHIVHALVVLVVVGCATLLGSQHVLDTQTVGGTYFTAIGYAAGRSGTRTNVRSGDSTDG